MLNLAQTKYQAYFLELPTWVHKVAVVVFMREALEHGYIATVVDDGRILRVVKKPTAPPQIFQT